MAEVRCPMCGKPNDDHLDECQHCGARLKPLLAGSETPPAQEPESQPDDWLRDLRGEEDPDDDFPDAGGGLPDWLLDSPEQEEIPEQAGQEADPGDDWLEGIRLGGEPEADDDFWDDTETAAEEPVQAPGASITESGIERLAMFEDEPEPASEPEPAPEPEPEQPVEDEPPAWVSGLHAVDTESAGRSLLDEEDLPDWLSELEAGGDPDAEELAPEGGEVPDWLAELGGEPEMSEAAPSGLEEDSPGPAPDWLAEFEKEAASDEPAAEEEDLAGLDSTLAGPDWLTGLDDAEEDAADEESPVPDWLAEFEKEPDSDEPAAEAVDALEDDRAPADPDWLSESGASAGPEWLADLDADEETEAGTPEPDWLRSAAGAGPTWLDELDDEDAGDEPEAPEDDWFADAGTPEVQPEAGQPEEDEWLAGFVDEDEETPETVPAAAQAPPDPGAGDDEVPDWLASALQQVDLGDEEDLMPGLGADADFPLPGADEDTDFPLPEIEPEPDRPAAAELPDWLTSFADEVEAPKAAGESPSQEKPDWLRGVGEAPAGPAAEQEPAGGELPDWLQELHDKTPDLGTESTTPDLQGWGERPAEEGDEFEPDAVDWMPGQSAGSPLELLGEAAGMQEDLAPGEIPDWLKSMQMVDATTPGTMETGEVDTGARERSGPLAGLRGVLSAEPVASQAGRPPAHSVRLQLTEAQQSRVSQLQKLVVGETEPQPAERQPVLSEQRVLRYGIAVLLFLAVLLPLLAPGRLVSLPPKPVEMDRLSGMISGLTSESIVLVAFDYQPALSGELDAAAAGVLDHVMLQNARLALVSTSPVGPALGERFVRLVESQHTYAYGTQYVNLGYIAGDATGLRLFAEAPRDAVRFGYDDRALWFLLDRAGSSPWNQPAAAGVSRLSDFDMVLLLSDDPDTVRRWMEQVSPVLRPGTLAVIVSAQAEPLVRPYLDSPDGRLAVLVPGLAGGASYEGFLLRDGPARAAWDGVGVGLLVAVTLILGAGGYNLFLAWSEREAARAGRRG